MACKICKYQIGRGIKQSKFRTRKTYRGFQGEGVIWDTIKSLGMKALQYFAPKLIQKGSELLTNAITKKSSPKAELSARGQELLNLIRNPR